MFRYDEQFERNMSGLDKLRTRLNYQGGASAEGRFVKDKLNSLKKSLLYSYQAEDMIMPDGRIFRGLINNDKLDTDYDKKILSMPFEDICIGQVIRDPDTGEYTEEFIKPYQKTTEGIISTGIKTGEVLEWKRTGTFWLVYLQHLEEEAYFRGSICQCTGEVDIDGTKYKVYLRGPAETELQWNQKNNTSWNDINYSLVMYITKDETTLNYFHRFTKVKITDETDNTDNWEVVVVNPYFGDGIIEVCLNEYFNNEMEDAMEQESPQEQPDKDSIYISGDAIVQPYDIVSYEINNAEGGRWEVSNKKAKIIDSNDTTVTLEIVTGKSGEFELSYIIDEEIYALPVTIKSL
jgi:hypothetical protein